MPRGSTASSLSSVSRCGRFRKRSRQALSDTAALATREEIVTRLYNEGWRQAAFDVVFELVDPGIVWTAIEGAPDAGMYRGHEDVRGYMQDWLDDFDLGDWRIEESIDAGDRLVCVQHARATGKASGVAGDLHYASTYRFGEDGRIVEVREFATRDEALAAIGHSSAPDTE